MKPPTAHSTAMTSAIIKGTAMGYVLIPDYTSGHESTIWAYTSSKRAFYIALQLSPCVYLCKNNPARAFGHFLPTALGVAGWLTAYPKPSPRRPAPPEGPGPRSDRQ